MPNLVETTAETLELHLGRWALETFTRSSPILLASELGRLAREAAREVFGAQFTADEQRRLAFARVATEAHRAGIRAQDWTVRVLVEMAMQELQRELDAPPKHSAMLSFYL